MMNNKSLMQMLIDAGYPEEDIHHHESDLYVYVTPLTRSVLDAWCDANGWHRGLVREEGFLFSTFTDNITGRKMYDIAGQYDPWWAQKLTCINTTK